MKRINPRIFLPLLFLPALIASGETAVILETKVISLQPEYYHGWPTVARRGNNELWVVWSGGRDGHVDPFGQVVAMTSRDEGRTWSWPRVLLDTALDDRDAGVLETAKGTLLVTTFTSSYYERQLDVVLSGKKSSHVREGRLPAWRAAHAWMDDAERKSQLGEWLIRSTDGGKTWSPPIPTIVNSPHGPIQLKDGRLLYAGKQLESNGRKIGVAESRDDGLTWQWLAEIPARPGDSAANYHELHAVEAGDGTLIAQIRTHNKNNNRETLQAESADGGRTWTEPRPIGVWGLPSHLLRLRDNRLVMTYGYRRAPFGNQARVSTDNGKTWGPPIDISSDGDSWDLGYPSTVELDDGTLLTVWYEQLKESPRAVLRQAKWKLAP
ncbi:sialidase family protein [Ereboglobus sp. PH5-10]|uniref:sialidase family protein n=1 Tax=Ereboglobus sp. PH5-10 TaxID=2940629 RepID=UPI0024058A09|nr:sialidase family protein [Ereboglobus sp. PH5-10]